MTGPRLGMGTQANDGWIAREFADLKRAITQLRAGGPMSPTVEHAQATGFATATLTTGTEIARITFTPPGGFTQAMVVASMTATARNSTAVQDYLFGYVDINGANHGVDSLCDAQPVYTTGLTNVATAVITGLSGPATPFYVRAMVGTGAAAWAPDPFNTCNVDAMVVYLR